MNAALLIAVVVLGALVAFLSFLVLGTLRALGHLTWRVEQLETITPSRIGRDGLKLGKKAPDFTLPVAQASSLVHQEQAGRLLNGAEEQAGTLALRPEASRHDFLDRKLLLIFTQSGCGPCRDIIPELNRVQDHGEHQVLVVNNGELEQTRKWAAEVQTRFPVLAQEKYSLSKRYEVFATPFAFLINEQRVITSKGIVGSRQYLNFVTGAGQNPQHDRADPESDQNEKSESAQVVSSNFPVEVPHV